MQPPFSPYKRCSPRASCRPPGSDLSADCAIRIQLSRIASSIGGGKGGGGAPGHPPRPRRGSEDGGPPAGALGPAGCPTCPLLVSALPAGAKPRSDRAARAGRRTGRERNDAKPPTESGARTRPRTHRERAARGLPTPVDRARRARCASARPLVVRALPAGAGARSKRAARAGRRTGRTLVVSAPPDGAGGARERHARSDRHEEKRKSRRRTQRANAPARLRRREPPVVYARAARVARASSVAPCAAPSLRSKRRPQKRCETRTTTGDREQEKITTVARTPLLDCGGESHQRCTRAPRARPTARPTRRCWASERESGARGATDGTNETTPNPQRRAAHERGGGLSDGAWRSDSQRTGRPTARVAFGLRLRTRSWCAPYPPARGLGARERLARGDGRDSETTRAVVG